MIRHIISVAPNGEIYVVRTPKGVDNLPEGIEASTGLYIVHYMSPIEDIANFIETMVWNYDDSEFVTRSPRPNGYAIWNGSSWVYNVQYVLGDLRIARNARLAECDWTQVSDSPLTESQRTQWRTYRQALRDFPETVGTTLSNINQVTWPTPPTT